MLRGVEWGSRIKEAIQSCDLFIVILTPAAIRIGSVKDEVMEALDRDKIILPCKSQTLLGRWEDLPWRLNEMDGLEFEESDELCRELDRKIELLKKNLQQKSISKEINILKKPKKPKLPISNFIELLENQENLSNNEKKCIKLLNDKWEWRTKKNIT